MRLLSLILTAWALVFVANGVENNAELGASKTFLKNYCVSCHGNEKVRAAIILKPLITTIGKIMNY